jgi:glycosyltransferase involved in cell wall biosynthesis
MKKPKVIFFMHRLDSEKDQITGGTRSTLLILQNLNIYTPVVIVNKRDLLVDELERLGIPYEVIIGEHFGEGYRRSFISKVKAVISLLIYNFKILRIIKRINPTLVHCDELGALMVFLGTKIAGKKLVIYVRNSFRGDNLRLIYKVPMLFADSIVAISKEIASFLSNKAGDIIRGKVTQIYNGIDLQSIYEFKNKKSKEECRYKLGIPLDCTAIGIVAFIDERKKQKDFLIHIVRHFNKGKKVIFYFVGGIKNQSYYAECRKIIEEFAIDNAIFAGYQSEIYYWYRAFDILCLPSEREGVPRAVLEAAAFELPVVAFNIAGCREAIIDGETGFLVDTFDVFALRLEKLIVNPKLRVEMGRKGYRYVISLFDAKHNTEKLERLYSSL